MAGVTSASPVTDPFWDQVVLLLGFHGADGSTGAPGMTDESLKAHGNAAVSNNAEISTANFRFETSSLGLNLSGDTDDMISFADSIDWQLSASNTDQFTIEGFVNFKAFTPIAITNGYEIIGQYFSSGRYSWGVMTNGYPFNELRFKLSSDGSTWNVDLTSSGANFLVGPWFYWAVDKDATGTVRLYVNGVTVGKVTPANSAMFNAANSLFIGNAPFLFDEHPLQGWQQEIRLTKGVARYAVDGIYTVPNAPFPRG